MTAAVTNPFQADTHSKLYEQDYALWLEQAVDLLRSQNFAEIDLENLVAELEGMGGSQKQAIESNLEVSLISVIGIDY